MMQTTISQLANFNFDSLTKTAGDTLTKATKLATGTAEKAVEASVKVGTEVSKDVEGVASKTVGTIKKVLPFGRKEK